MNGMECFAVCQMSFLGVYGRSMRYMYTGISNNILYYTITNVKWIHDSVTLLTWLLGGGAHLSWFSCRVLADLET